MAGKRGGRVPPPPPQGVWSLRFDGNSAVEVWETVVVDTLRPGQRVQVEYPANGMTVAVSRTVREANGRVLHSETLRTHYALWNGRMEIGR